jgi:hypothetical protein
MIAAPIILPIIVPFTLVSQVPPMIMTAIISISAPVTAITSDVTSLSIIIIPENAIIELVIIKPNYSREVSVGEIQKLN